MRSSGDGHGARFPDRLFPKGGGSHYACTGRGYKVFAVRLPAHTFTGMSEPDYPDREPPCSSCRHFCVRMGDAFPYQCLLWEFSVANGQYPSRMVYSSTGRHCPYHLQRRFHPAKGGQAKPPPPPEKEGDVDFTV